jgi:hypothetical protein
VHGPCAFLPFHSTALTSSYPRAHIIQDHQNRGVLLVHGPWEFIRDVGTCLETAAWRHSAASLCSLKTSSTHHVLSRPMVLVMVAGQTSQYPQHVPQGRIWYEKLTDSLGCQYLALQPWRYLAELGVCRTACYSYRLQLLSLHTDVYTPQLNTQMVSISTKSPRVSWTKDLSDTLTLRD